MKLKKDRWFVIAYMLFTFAFFISLIIAKIFYKQTSEKRINEAKNASTVDINWEDIYPYDTAVEEVESGVIRKKPSKTEKALGKIRKLSMVGSEWVGFASYYDGISKAGYVINSLLKDPSMGTAYVKNRNGYMAYARQDKTSMDDAKDSVVAYASLQKYLGSKGIDFLYFYVPSKACNVDWQFLEGVICYDNENIDTCLEAMDLFGIDYVDLRKNMHAEGLDHYSLYYLTDHHWRVETGLWAASEIAKELNNRFGYSMPEADSIGEYKCETYKSAEFGSQGETVTRFIIKPEDFNVLYPEFDTDYRLEIPNKGIDERGTFRELFVDEEGIKEVTNDGGGAAYGKILCGNPPYVSITNYKNPNGPKVLMIRDSYGSAVAPYLAGSCSQLVLLDMRIENGNFTGSVINCINQFQPDIVVTCQCGPQALLLNK